MVQTNSLKGEGRPRAEPAAVGAEIAQPRFTPFKRFVAKRPEKKRAALWLPFQSLRQLYFFFLVAPLRGGVFRAGALAAGSSPLVMVNMNGSGV
jgi:hypothetical protein